MISVYIPDLRTGGAERIVVHLVNEFASRGISTDLVLSRLEGSYLTDVNEGVNIINLNATRYPGYAAMGAYRPLRSYFEQKQPTVFLSALARANVVALLAHRMAKVDTRIVVSEHNTLSSRIKGSKDLKMKALPWMIRLTYRWADNIIAVSDGVGDDLAQTCSINRNQIKTIYNPVYNRSIPQKSKEKPDHPWFDESKKKKEIIVAVGGVDVQKDYPTLLRAFSRVQRNRSVQLIIVGTGDKQELKKLVSELGIQEKVSFPGFVDNVYSYMGNADIFVLSSRWEGLPTVLIEALACGTPVVSTNCPSGPNEILSDGEYGPLVPVGDHRALAEAIEKVLDDPIDSKKLRRRAEDFSVEEIADQYLETLLPNWEEQTTTSV